MGAIYQLRKSNRFLRTLQVSLESLGNLIAIEAEPVLNRVISVWQIKNGFKIGLSFER